MKFITDNPSYICSGMSQIGTITKKISRGHRGMILIILIIALTACNRPQQASSGAQSGSSTSSTPTPSGTAGGAVLNLERSVDFFLNNGTDIQREVGAIQLKFSKAEEEGFFLVEGTGKTEWLENAVFTGCDLTAKAEGKVIVTGIFNPNDCKFHLNIATDLSQPTTSANGPNCSGSIVFTNTKFSSDIIVSPDSSYYKETPKAGAWWKVVTIKISDLKNDEIKFCFLPEVIK